MRLAATVGISLLLLVSVRTRAADARFVQVGKTVWYTQSGAGSLTNQINAYEFRARVDATKADAIGAVGLKPPLPLTTRVLSNLVTYWEFSQRFPSIETMNLAAPNGTYSVITQGALDGKHTNLVTLSADVYPNPVHVANFPAAQKVNGKADFTLQWDPPGTSAGDMIQVRIFSNDQLIFQTGSVPGAAGTLNGSATTCVIPKNTLADGAVFRAQVIATRKSTSDPTGYPGVAAWALYARATEFAIRTTYPILDVSWYGIAKVRRFTQNSVLAPLPVGSGGFAFSAFTLATDPLNVQSASVKLANAKVKTLAANGASWTSSESFDTQQQLDTACPSGAYELDIQTKHNSTQRLPLSLAAIAFPPPLQISNWNEASAFDSARPFTLKWLALAGGTADDFIQVSVSKNGKVLFETGDYPGSAGALDGRSSSVVLPAGLLQPGESADVILTCYKALSSDPFSYPQSLGTASWGCETRSILQAAGGNLPAPNLSGARIANSILEFNVACAQGRQQVIQVSRDLAHWSDIFVTNAPSNSFLLRFSIDKLEHSIAVRVRTN